MNEFLDKVAEILEVDSVDANFEFRSVAEWDSMKGFSLIVLLEGDYGKQMSVNEFMDCKTVGDLANFAGVK